MSKLTWSATGKRYYEAGVDRGVLYVGDLPGVSWTGLTSVSESPTGGEAKPYYLDGIKYLNVSSSEEFEATIEAFSSPPEFGPCDGVVSIQNGLFVTQQLRKSFGLSYRTRVGNDTDGLDHGYKIHLLYNALAAPSERNYNTLSDSVNLSTFSWKITTLPPSLTGYKPTAHLVIDSRKTPAGLMASVEDILYGSALGEARLPTTQELADMFKSEGPILLRNLITNPSFRVTSGTTEIRRNFAADPRATSSTLPITTLGWRTGRWFGNNAQTGTYTYVTGASDGWAGIGSYLRKTWTGPIVTTTTSDTGYDNGRTPVAPGETWAASGMLRSSLLQVAKISFYWYDSGGVQIGRTNLDTQLSTLQPNVWTKVAGTITVPTVPAGVTSMGVSVDMHGIGGTIWTVGSTLDGTALLVEKSDEKLTYFDGMSSPTDAGWVYSWTGATNASASVLTAPKIAAGNLIPNNPYTVGGQAGTDRLRILRKVSGQGLLGYLATTFAASAGDFYAARMQVRQIGGSSTVSVNGRIRYYDSTSTSIGETLETQVSIPANDSWVDLEMKSDLAAPSGTTSTRVNLYATTVPLGTTLEVRRVLMCKVDGTNVAPPAYFDGSTPDVDGNFYHWEGTPDASTSIVNSWN